MHRNETFLFFLNKISCNNRKLVCVFIAFSTIFIQVHGQKSERYTISGYVKEVISGESLIGVNIYLSDHTSGTTTNAYGFFSLTLPASDSVRLIVSYIGFATETIGVSLNKNLELNVQLKPSIILDEVTVTAEKKDDETKSARMSIINLPVAQIKNVPAFMGENDVLKVLQLMPGVQSGSEGSSGLYVRGGGPDQNLIILDDAIVYNASHLFGFFSLFNGDALKSVELTKGGFPARYGGRLSSVLEMNMKEGNKEEWHVEGGLGMIASRMTVEGPIKKGKSSILLSGRRTYADVLIYPFMKNTHTGYYFYDFNAKINYDFGRNNKLYLSGYFGQDKYYSKLITDDLQDESGFRWGNGTGTLRWNHLFSNKLFSNLSLVYSKYSFELSDKYKVVREGKDYYAEYYSGIRDLTLKYDIDYLPSPNHSVKAGLISIYHRFNPHAFVEADVASGTHFRDNTYTDGIESGLYAEDTWQPVPRLKINGGLRFSHFIAENNKYHFFEPRLSLAWRLSNDLAVKGSFARMDQYIHMISNTGISLPTDLWVPTTDRVKPQQSQQVALGFVKELSRRGLDFSMEGYYKNMKNVLVYKEGATFLAFDNPEKASFVNWEDNVTGARAWSYGIEFLLRKKEGRLTGWIGYTLSWTQLQSDSINSGKKYYARYDRRHDISVVATYKINDRITLSGTWVYGTGNAVSLPNSIFWVSADSPKLGHDINAYFYNNRGILYSYNNYGQKNGYRMAAYHRLDLGIQFHKSKKWGERTWAISVYNAYNRMNPYYYYSSSEIRNNKTYRVLKQVSLFPVIPSISYSFRF
jgi:hypothetical protein